jgi:hypothetical protein
VKLFDQNGREILRPRRRVEFSLDCENRFTNSFSSEIIDTGGKGSLSMDEILMRAPKCCGGIKMTVSEA